MLIMDPVKGLETAASALQNTGDTVVFDNVNMVSALVLGLKRLLAGKSSGNLRAAFRSLASGVDELLFIGGFLLVIDRLLAQAGIIA